MHLQGSPEIVNGTYDCYGYLIKSLKNSTLKEAGNFECSHNNLIDLVGSPKTNGFFWCNDNGLTSLKGCPEIINGDFECRNNKEKRLTKEDLPEYVIIKGKFI